MIWVAHYCKCGRFVTGILPEADRKHIERIRRIWKQLHTGPGHEPYNAPAAQTARAVEDRARCAPLVVVH